MNCHGVVGDRFDRNKSPYGEIGTFETSSYDEAMDKGHGHASSHPNAAAHVLRDGDPFLLVHHTYDRNLDQGTECFKDCEYGRKEVGVNGKTVRDTRGDPMPAVDGWQIGGV